MSSEPHAYPAPDLSSPQFTVRAIITGMLLGGTLSLCNVYMGLKIGWGFNMSITAALLSYGFWQALHVTFKTRTWGKLENNINQTAASSAASISSAGLVAPIPALTLITGYEMSYFELVSWTFSVSLVGVVVAIGLRRQMLIVDALPFPNGIAAGETLNEMYSRGAEAMARVKVLIAGSIFGAGLKLGIKLFSIPNWYFPGFSIGAYSFKNLTMAITPSPLFVAVGAIVGIRAGLSMLLGALIGWLMLAPMALGNAWAVTGKPEGLWFKNIVEWLLWPGVALMVTASLTSFSFSWRSILNAIKGGGGGSGSESAPADEVPRTYFLIGVGVALAASVALQITFFGIGWGLATFGVLLTFLLAVVAARVSGETGITPVGPMGKVTQLTFGAVAADNVTANLMAANVTGGAASQCADLLHDMKTGLMVGASPRLQTYSQVFGTLAGAICGSAAYIVLVPDVQVLWDDPEWAMPAVVQWKAVAEIFQKGIENLPAGAVAAMIWGGAVGVVLAIAEKIMPKNVRQWVPSPTGVGLALVIPAYYSISMAMGGILAFVLGKVASKWAKRFMIVLAAGVIAGDSLTGVVLAILKIAGIDF
jgi:uncharacterized oligopeptide transporter (OPT) family protein